MIPVAAGCGTETDGLDNGSVDGMDMGPADTGGPNPDGGNPVELGFSTMRIEFGEIPVGSVSQERSVTIENIGSAPVDSLTAEPEPGFITAAFSFSLGQADLPVGDSTELTVVFEPDELGAAASAILVTGSANGMSSEITVNLEGTGTAPPVTVTPTELDFGNVVLGTTATREMEVTNQSGAEVTVEFLPDDNVSICDGASPGAFCLRSPTPDFMDTGSFTLGVAETQTLQFELTPTIPGAMEQSIFDFRYCPDPSCIVEGELLGIGIELGLECMPSPLAFGVVQPGTCAQESLVCENVGNELISVLSFGREDGTSNEFVPQPSVPTQLDPALPGLPRSSVGLPLEYCPNDSGVDTGAIEVQISSEDTGPAVVTVPVEGEGA